MENIRKGQADRLTSSLPVSPPCDRVTVRNVDSQISKNNYCNELHLSLIARIADLSNKHGQHRPQGLYLSKQPRHLPSPLE